MKISHLIYVTVVLSAPLVRADDPARYQALWTKSPFAVASADAGAEESPDYFLVGVACEDGIFYASVIERQTQEHFLLASDKAVRGLTLKSISRTPDGQATFAEVLRDGQTLTLKLDRPPVAAAGRQVSFSNGAALLIRARRTPMHLPVSPQAAPQ